MSLFLVKAVCEQLFFYVNILFFLQFTEIKYLRVIWCCFLVLVFLDKVHKFSRFRAINGVAVVLLGQGRVLSGQTSKLHF